MGIFSILLVVIRMLLKDGFVLLVMRRAVFKKIF